MGGVGYQDTSGAGYRWIYRESLFRIPVQCSLRYSALAVAQKYMFQFDDIGEKEKKKAPWDMGGDIGKCI